MENLVQHACRGMDFSMISDYFGQQWDKTYKAKELFKELEDIGQNKDWIDNLDDIRADIEHNYSAWISFKKIDSNYILTLSLPKSLNKHKAHKKYHKDSLDTKELNGMINKYDDFFEKAIDLLLKKL